MKMSEITVGMYFEDERTNEFFTVTGKNSKNKTVSLERTDGDIRNVSINTITKHFVEVMDLDDLSTPAEPEPESVVEEPVVEPAKVEEPEEKKEEPKKRKRQTRAKVTRFWCENGTVTPVPF